MSRLLMGLSWGPNWTCVIVNMELLLTADVISACRHLLPPSTSDDNNNNVDDGFLIYDYLNRASGSSSSRRSGSSGSSSRSRSRTAPSSVLNNRLAKRRPYSYTADDVRSPAAGRVRVRGQQVFHSVNKRLPGECFNSCVAGGMKEYQCRGICLR